MEISGWQFDFASLPRWDMRERDAYIEDILTENALSDTACLLYSITEASMMNFVGCLALFRNKAHPELVSNVHTIRFPRQEVVYSADGNLLFLNTRIDYRMLLVVIDLRSFCFSYVPVKTLSSCYTVEERSGQFVFCVDAHQAQHDKRLHRLEGKEIKIERLKWHPLSELNEFDKTIKRKHLLRRM